MPRDGLALAILIGREIELVRVLQQLLEVADLFFGPAGHDVERLEVVLDVDTEIGPLLGLVCGRNLRRSVREVADMADGGLDDVVVAEKARDGSGFCGGLNDDERCGHGDQFCNIGDGVSNAAWRVWESTHRGRRGNLFGRNVPKFSADATLRAR